MEIAYIQKQDGEFINSSAYQAWEGFKSLGIKVDTFEYKQLINGYLPTPLNKQTIICGFISSVRWALKELDIPEPVIADYPTELEKYLGRKVYTSTLGEAKKINQKIFIKPLAVKLFRGLVCNNTIHTLVETAMHPDDTEIYISEPVEFVSEYRVFVNHDFIVGCKHYAGDFTITPHFNLISQAIADYRSAPIAYAIDFGITKDGRTLLIEVNDAWALGCYGLDSKTYARVLLNRWMEIISHETSTSVS